MDKKIIIKRILIVVFFVLLTMVTISELNKGSVDFNSNLSKNKVVEITFSSSWGGADIRSQALEKVLEEFEKENPDIKVKNRSRGNDDFLYTLKTDFAQGNEPDVFGLWPGSDERKLISSGKVANLSPILDEDMQWKHSFKTEAWDYVTFGDKIYALPLEIIYEGLFINKSLFHRYNIKVPENYEELKNSVKEFRKHNIIPIAFNCTPEGTYLYQNIVMKLGGKEDIENPYASGKISENYIKGMNYMKELYEMKAFPEDVFIIDDKARNNLFLQKKAAMIVQGSWFIGDGAVSSLDKDIQLIPFPVFEEGAADKSAIVYGVGNGNFHMSSRAFYSQEKREASIKLLKYLTTEEVAKVLINSTGSMANLRITDDTEEKGLILTGRNMVKSSRELVGPPDSFIERTNWENILVKKFPEMLEGNVSPEEIFEEME
ncbi:ABC transporter substrate-binding protein [Clostridium thermarum]|uniref:ABC transporter substrate-binding protein n=1 Tax=Clostridium thermarum TaxID=1716543 RepID=UPI0013D22492|nr:extracellular solute-binding protein [Clostridium thermarum]